MKKQRWNNLRPIAIAVTLAFAAEQVAFAAPIVSTIVPASLKPQINFSLPQSVAVVDDSYKAPGNARLLILIQDAHTNDSGQMNVAKALSEILPKEKIDTVFTEADSGDVSLNYLKPLFSQSAREKVGRQLVRRGELRGHDYANLTGADFRLVGVEDPSLYRETLETYRDLTLKRDKVRVYVDRVQRSAEALKSSLFSDTLKMLDAKRVANAKGDLTLADYADTLLKESSRTGLNAARYPHIKFLRRLRTIEKRVDFKKASAEERAAMKALPFADRKELLEAHKTAKSGPAEENGFYTLFEEKLKAAGVLGQFSDLAKYFDYLKETRKMNALGVVGEVKGLEEELFLSLAQNRDEAVLWMFSRNLETLQNLINLKVSPDEFNAVRTQGPLYDIKLIAGFLNRKIADLKLHYENALTLEDGYDAAWKDAIKFYELTLDRDRVYLDRVRATMSAEDIDKAVLITGGYHTPNLKAMLKSAGYSYVVLLPQVLHETDAARYERLLLAQLKQPAASGARIASGSRPARQEAAMAQQVSAARLAEALRVEDPGVQTRDVIAARERAVGAQVPAVSAARMADYVLDQDRRQVLTSGMSMALIAISEVLQIQGRNFNLQIDVNPDNSEGPTVVTFGDTSDSHDFVPVPASSLEFRSVPDAPKSFRVALPKSVPAFDVRIKDGRGSFVGILSIKATPSVRTIVEPGSAGPFAYDIEIAFTPGRTLSGIGARMAELKKDVVLDGLGISVPITIRQMTMMQRSEGQDEPQEVIDGNWFNLIVGASESTEGSPVSIASRQIRFVDIHPDAPKNDRGENILPAPMNTVADADRRVNHLAVDVVRDGNKIGELLVEIYRTGEDPLDYEVKTAYAPKSVNGTFNFTRNNGNMGSLDVVVAYDPSTRQLKVDLTDAMPSLDVETNASSVQPAVVVGASIQSVVSLQAPLRVGSGEIQTLSYQVVDATSRERSGTIKVIVAVDDNGEFNIVARLIPTTRSLIAYARSVTERLLVSADFIRAAKAFADMFPSRDPELFTRTSVAARAEAEAMVRDLSDQLSDLRDAEPEDRLLETIADAEAAISSAIGVLGNDPVVELAVDTESDTTGTSATTTDAVDASGWAELKKDSGVDLARLDVDQNPHQNPMIVRTPEGDPRNEDDASYVGGLFAKFLAKYRQIKAGTPGAVLAIGRKFFGTSMISPEQRKRIQGMTYYRDYKNRSAEYETFAAERVVVTRQVLDGGKGLGVAREAFLKSLGLLEYDEKGKPIFGAKATDIQRPIPWNGDVNEAAQPIVNGERIFGDGIRVNADGFLQEQGTGKELLVSIAELKLLHALEEAQHRQFRGMRYLPIVSEDSKPSYEKLLSEGRYLPDVLSGVQQPRTYRQVADEHGLRIPEASDWLVARDVPVFDVDTQNLVEDKSNGKYTTGGGHGQWGHWNLRAAWQTMKAAAQRLVGQGIDPSAVRTDAEQEEIQITEIVSGDGLNGNVPRAVIGAMAKEGIPVVMLVTARTPIDAKGGVVGVELLQGDSLDEPGSIAAMQMIELAQAKAAEASGVDGESDRFGRVGLDEDESTYGRRGEEAFNTNVAAVNTTVVGSILVELEGVLIEHYSAEIARTREDLSRDEIVGLAQAKAKDRLSEIMGPNLIEKLVNRKDGAQSHIQLEGAMGLALLSLNRFFEHPNESGEGFDVERIRAILTARGLSKIVTPVFFTAEERDVVFTPIKTGFDAWFQMFGGFYELDIRPGSPTRWRYQAIQRQDGSTPTPPDMDIDLKDPYWSEIQSWTEAFGRNSDTRTLTRIKLKVRSAEGLIVAGNSLLRGEVELFNESTERVDLRTLDLGLNTSDDGRLVLENIRITVQAGEGPVESRIVVEQIGAQGARVVDVSAGARMALSPVRTELEKIGGYQDPTDLTLRGVQSDAALKKQFDEALYMLSRPNVLEKDGREAEFPIVFEYPNGRVGILSAQVRLSGGSIELRLGDDSASFGVKTIESDIAPARRTELDEQGQVMGVFSGSLRALMDAVETNRLEDPLHFRRKLDASSVDIASFLAAEDKVRAFGAWARNMALVYRAAHKKQQNALGEDAPGIKLHLVLSGLDKPLADAVLEQLKSFAGEEWLNVIDKGEVTSEMLQQNGREALLVDVKTASPTMHGLAVGAHVVGRLMNGVVPDEAAAAAASLNTVGAVELGDGSSARERFATGRTIDDAGALGRINANYDADKKASSLDVYLGDFYKGELKYPSRTLKISIGRLLQTMRMMITQVAMAA